MSLYHSNVVLYPNRTRRKGVSKLFWLLLVFFGCILLIGCYLASPMALLTEITIAGNVKLAREEILAITGLEPGQHLWRLNLTENRDKLFTSPWVEEVQISRVFPNSLAITLQERVGVAIITGASGSWVVAGDGVVLAVNEGYSLPWVTGLPLDNLKPGSVLEGQAAAAALDWVFALQSLGAQVSEVNLSDYPVQVTLFTTDGYKVVFASDANLAQRVNDLMAMLQDLRAANLKGIIDFRTGKGRGIFSPWPGNSDIDS